MSYLTALKPIGDFILEVEGNGVYLSEFFVAYRRLIAKLTGLNSEPARCLTRLLNERFKETADINLAQLAYFFTRDGFNEYQALLKPLKQYAWGSIVEDQEGRWALYNALSNKMIELCVYFGTENAVRDIGAMFYSFTMNYNLTDEPFIMQMKKLGKTPMRIGDRDVLWEKFTEPAVKLALFPATESAAERVISILERHFTASRSSLKDDLFSSEARIVVQKSLDKYNEKINLTRSLEA